MQVRQKQPKMLQKQPKMLRILQSSPGPRPRPRQKVNPERTPLQSLLSPKLVMLSDKAILTGDHGRVCGKTVRSTNVSIGFTFSEFCVLTKFALLSSSNDTSLFSSLDSILWAATWRSRALNVSNAVLASILCDFCCFSSFKVCLVIF